MQGQAEYFLEKLHGMAEKQVGAFLDGTESAEGWPKFRENLIGLTDVTRTHFDKLVSVCISPFPASGADFDGLHTVLGMRAGCSWNPFLNLGFLLQVQDAYPSRVIPCCDMPSAMLSVNVLRATFLYRSWSGAWTQCWMRTGRLAHTWSSLAKLRAHLRRSRRPARARSRHAPPRSRVALLVSSMSFISECMQALLRL